MRNTERIRLPRVLADRRGVSLIETLVALGLFAVTAGTMGQFLVAQIRHASTNHLYTKAYAIAEEELEALRTLRYDDMTPGSKEVPVGGTTFSVSTTVDEDTPAGGLKQITVDVSWNDPEGPRNVSVYTIYTEVRRY